MFEIRQTETYAQWFMGLRDRIAKARIDARIRRMTLGHFGDVHAVGGGVWEMRVDHGHGYRVYYVRSGATVILLLAGGDKDTQVRDIRLAQALASQL